MARYGVTLTVQAGKMPSSQVNFAWVATADNFPIAAIDGGTTSILNGGGNLRCYTDSTKATQIPVEVVVFSTGGSPDIQVWGLSPTLNVASTVYIEADTVATAQPAVGAAFGRNSTWTDREYQYNLTSGIADSKGVTTPLITGSPITDNTSPFGGGIKFRANEYVDLGQNIGDTVGDLSLSAWIKPTSTNEFATIVSIRDSGGWSYQWRLEALDPSLLIGGSSPNSPGPALVTGSWYMLTLVVSGSVISYYRNGAVQGTASVSGTRSLRPATNTFIGNNSEVSPLADIVSTLSIVSARLTAITADSVTSEYNNQSSPSTFWATGAWTDQDAGAGVTVTPNTINSVSVSNNPLIAFNSVVNVSPNSINSVSTVLNPLVSFSSSINITPNTINSVSAANNPSIDFASLLQVTPLSIDSASTTNNPVISFTSSLVISPVAINSLSSSLDPLIEFKSVINLTPNSIDSSSTANNPFITTGAVQTIGNVTSSFAIDAYSVKYKQSTITVNFK